MSVPAIKTLRASGTSVQAEVIIGCNEYGSGVAVMVNLQRKDPALETALAPLEALLVERATEHVTRSVQAAEYRDAVRTAVAQQLDRDRKRIESNARSAAERELADVRRELSSSKILAESQSRAMAAMQERLDQFTIPSTHEQQG